MEIVLMVALIASLYINYLEYKEKKELEKLFELNKAEAKFKMILESTVIKSGQKEEIEKNGPMYLRLARRELTRLGYSPESSQFEISAYKKASEFITKGNHKL